MGGWGARFRAAVAAVALAGLGPSGLGGVAPAAPTASPSSGEAPLTVAFSPNIPDGAYYQWQFDRKPGGPFAADYASETADPVSFTYTAPGAYTAVLRIHDALGGVADHVLSVQVLPPARPPAVVLQASAAIAMAGAPVTFTATASASPGRTITAYLWDMDGDGRADETRPAGPSAQLIRAFDTTGTYVVGVTAVDDQGLSGTASSSVEVRRAPSLSFPEPVPPAAVAGEAYTFTASAAAHPPATLAGWSWDFGDGTSAVGGPPKAHTYPTVGGRTVTVTVTDSFGLSTTALQGIRVVSRPTLVPDASVTEFRVWAFPPLGTSVTQYRWDVGDDGTIDGTSPGGPTGAFPGRVGRMRVHVHLSNGTVMTEEWSVPVLKGSTPRPITPFVRVRAIEGASQVDATSIAPPPTLSVRVGHVVRFTADAQVDNPDGAHGVEWMIWDFEGDGLRDQTDTFVGLQPTVAGIPAEFQFQNVGRTSAVVKALETVGGTAQATVTIDVVPGTGALETWISQPRPGQRIWGNRVSLQARASPANRVGRVDFEYRPAAGGAWKRIGTVVPPPYSSLGALWDVTRVPAGDYDLRARATSADGLETADSEALRTVRITIDPAAPEVSEFAADGASPAVREHSIDPAASNRTEIAGDTAIEFPPAAFAARATVRMERPSSNPHPLEARQQGLHFVPGSFRRLHLVGQTLDKPSRIALYDLNPNGVLDALAVDKTRLRIFQFDDDLRQWVPLFSQVVQPNEDLVRATFVSMGDVGLVVDRAAPDGAAGSSGGCGLLGAELFLVLLAVRRLRPA